MYFNCQKCCEQQQLEEECVVHYTVILKPSSIFQSAVMSFSACIRDREERENGGGIVVLEKNFWRLHLVFALDFTLTFC